MILGTLLLWSSDTQFPFNTKRLVDKCSFVCIGAFLFDEHTLRDKVVCLVYIIERIGREINETVIISDGFLRLGTAYNNRTLLQISVN